MTTNFFIPPASVIGRGAVKEVGTRLKQIGAKKALIVTDAFLHSTGLSEEVAKNIREAGVDVAIFPKAQPDPADTQVHEGVDVFKQENCDSLVSIGGGSSHDTAKAIGLVAANGGRINDYQGVNSVEKPVVPVVAITTTAGTGSETTSLAVITDSARKVKMPVIDEKITPTVAIVDPELMVKKPAGLTIATGMDALSHAIEAYVAKGATPVTDAFAIQAMKLINEYLPKAVANGEDIEAREKMAYAQYMAGVAFNNGGLGLVHSISHQVGGVYKLQHGICNSVNMPHVCAFNLIAKTERFAHIAELLGENVAGLSTAAAAERAIVALERINKSFGIPSGYAEMGVKEEDIELLAKNAYEDVCTQSNPRVPTVQDIAQIIKNAM
ncbi:iron-containing alcohol dehydrogenase [Bacillus methanolicus]|uniref:NAD(P)-dependent methanol dehydrogenase n=2 Tax=Bacillus methanolicus TaxID=1471 RepID=Q6TV41_BACMM|nr:iron-containing alcohol dehydrogenase [Bacillus methanolicus]AAR39405.1 NAD(P)-dependent methanol dehydrogenase [Bacillus methanolicus MGA3]AIE61787.1 NAD-dependent methanol dehydrogenase [Bacillus methanolicus MGA3]EIJ77596.1 NAD-dependent methanol dehydrogenase [Bacillus methanolicus MGA3]